MAAADGSLTKHGFPRGYRFVPTSLELISILSDQIRGRALPPPLHTIFHDVRILDYHPEELYGISLSVPCNRDTHSYYSEARLA